MPKPGGVPVFERRINKLQPKTGTRPGFADFATRSGANLAATRRPTSARYPGIYYRHATPHSPAVSAGPAALAASEKGIFVITDAEGIAGLCRRDLTEPHDQELRQSLAGEVNAAMQGFLDGGADEMQRV